MWRNSFKSHFTGVFEDSWFLFIFSVQNFESFFILNRIVRIHQRVQHGWCDGVDCSSSNSCRMMLPYSYVHLPGHTTSILSSTGTCKLVYAHGKGQARQHIPIYDDWCTSEDQISLSEIFGLSMRFMNRNKLDNTKLKTAVESASNKSICINLSFKGYKCYKVQSNVFIWSKIIHTLEN